MFVDDEPQILKGIVRMLECADVDWDIETAESGDVALELMKEEPVDVLVSDMKMPGMDGAQLLGEVSRLYPETVRIILSGQANKESVYRAVSPMHQYLSKPCEAEKLRQTIDRSCSLRELLDKTESHDFLGRISNLPSLPDIYEKVVAEIESENGTVANVGRLIAGDPAMTVKILQLANSAIFGLCATVTAPAHAASLVGMDALKSLVLSLSVFKSFEATSVPGFSIDALASHSLRVGGLGRRIAKLEGLDTETMSEAFTAGLLHDVGKLILASHASEDYVVAMSKSKAEGMSLHEAEKEIFGLGHDGIGGYLLSLWGLPQNIVESVAFHHTASECKGSTLTPSSIVYIANHLSNSVSNRVGDEAQACFDNFIDELGLSDRVSEWCDDAAEDDEIR